MTEASARSPHAAPIDLARETDFVLGTCQVRPSLGEVIAQDQTIKLQHRVMEVLVALVRADGEVISRDDLLSSCWGGLAIGDDAISRCIGRLRRLAELETAGAFEIETLARIGYRLTAQAALVGPTVLGKPSIAVMPFANLSGDVEQDYFADGMVEEIVTALSRHRSIFVIGSGSTLSFKGQAVGSQDVGRQLGVRYILEGSVRKAADRVRIVIRLIDAGDGAMIWTDKFEDTLADVFVLQDRVALSVAGMIEPTMQVAEIRRAAKRPTENMGSYDLYLRAWLLHRKYTKADTLEALDFVNRAIAFDPDYGSALVLAAVCHNLMDLYGWSDDAEANRRRGVEMARRALAVAGDDASVLAHAAFAVAHLEHDDAAAVALLERAIGLNPGCSAVWFMSGLVRLRIGETDLAVTHLETAMRLDPIGPDVPNQIGFMAWARFQQSRFQESVALATEFVRQKDHPRGYAFLAASYGHLGKTEAAKAALDRYRALAPQPIDAFARSFILDPVHRKSFLDGIAVADA
jgi:TolB-like protein